VPGYTQQQTLVYEHREDDIAVIGHAISLLCHGDTHKALEVLQNYRNGLQDRQKPRLADYDPQAEARSYARLAAL
jgi:hypothetical protein